MFFFFLAIVVSKYLFCVINMWVFILLKYTSNGSHTLHGFYLILFDFVYKSLYISVCVWFYTLTSNGIIYCDVAYVDDDDTKKEMRTNSQSHYRPAQVLLCVIRNVTIRFYVWYSTEKLSLVVSLFIGMMKNLSFVQNDYFLYEIIFIFLIFKCVTKQGTVLVVSMFIYILYQSNWKVNNNNILRETVNEKRLNYKQNIYFWTKPNLRFYIWNSIFFFEYNNETYLSINRYDKKFENFHKFKPQFKTVVAGLSRKLLTLNFNKVSPTLKWLVTRDEDVIQPISSLTCNMLYFFCSVSKQRNVTCALVWLLWLAI